MSENELSQDRLAEALGDKRFANALQKLADAYVHADRQMPDPIAKLLREHWLQLVEALAGQSAGAEIESFEDTGDDINPLRLLWRNCFEIFAQREVRATNVVNKNWQSSGSANIDIQRQAVARGVSITRIFILDADLPEQLLHELRYNVIRQLNAGIKLRVVRPQDAETQASAEVNRIGSKDFIIFDDNLVYATIIDWNATDRRTAQRARVQLLSGSEQLEAAAAAWEKLIAYGDPLTSENLHKYVDPYGTKALKQPP